MFSHNGRISERQLRRMLVLSVFAGGIFVIPHMAAKLFGDSVVWGLGIFFVFACMYVGCIYGITHNFNFVEAASDKGVGGRLLLVIQIMRQFFRLVFYVLLSVAVLKEAQVPFMHSKESHMNLLAVLPLMLVAAYGAIGTQRKNEKKPHGIEKQGRLYELIFWVLFVPFIIMLLFGFSDVDWHVFMPGGRLPVGKLLFYALILLWLIAPVENYVYIRPCLGDKKGQRSYFSVVFTLALIVFLTLAALGIYGVQGAASEEMLTIAIMRYIKLPFGILGRFDSLLVWFFMTGCFVLISQTLYFISVLASGVFPSVKIFWVILLASAVGLLVPVFLPDYSHMLPLFMKYGAMIDLALSVVIPLLIRSAKKIAVASAALVLALGLWGCGQNVKEPEVKSRRVYADMRNVEERDYATIMIIKKCDEEYEFTLGIAKEKRVGEKSVNEKVCKWSCGNLEELADAYAEEKGKDLSLAHLKVILCVADKGNYTEDVNLLKLLDQDVEIAKTVPLLLLKDEKEFLDYLEDMEKPVGNYVENLIAVKNQEGKDVSAVADYLKAWRENQRVRSYYLVKTKEGFRIEY